MQRVLDVAAMYGNPVMAVERNGCGTEVAQKLFFDRGYTRFVNHGAKQGRRGVTRAGINSVKNLKNAAVANFRKWLIDGRRVKMRDEEFLNELRHFDYRGGKWGATNNEHDDLVMSAVWTLFMLSPEVADAHFDVVSRDADGGPLEIANRFEYKIDGAAEPERTGIFATRYSRYRAGVLLYSNGPAPEYDPELGVELGEFEANSEYRGWSKVSYEDFMAGKDTSRRREERAFGNGYWTKPVEGRNFLL